MYDVDIPRLHAIDRECAAQDERAERTALHGNRLAFEIAHRAHTAAPDDDIGAVRYIDDQDDPRLQPIGGEPEQFVQADDHSVDRLVAKGAHHFTRRRIFDELHGGRIETPQLTREIEWLAADPDVRTDAQRGFLPAATEERKRQGAACQSAHEGANAPAAARHVTTLRPERKCSPRS